VFSRTVGTFRGHSVRVERTPVSLHPNCKKHVKKVPRLTQNTTCKHEYLRRGLTRPNDVQGTFREHSGNIQGTFREHSGNIQGTFSEHSGVCAHRCSDRYTSAGTAGAMAALSRLFSLAALSLKGEPIGGQTRRIYFTCDQSGISRFSPFICSNSSNAG
jgi:hypothetical protein